MNLVYWQRRPSGHLVGAALERSRWISDLVAVLPETESGGASSDRVTSSFRVVNSASEMVYDWGPGIEEKAALPRQRLAVITSEAQRLSRLIGNVLKFARQKRKTLEPRPYDY